MIWPFRKASSNGWQALARGANIPAKPGQKFDFRLENGDEVYGLVYGRASNSTSLDGRPVQYDGDVIRSALINESPTAITHYRLHKPETADDVAVRANRENLWRDLATNPNADVGGFEEPKRQPAKVR